MRIIDKWIGDNLFVPLIIKLCQTTAITQYRFHNVLTYVGLLMLLYSILSVPFSLFQLVFGVIIVLVILWMTAILALIPDMKFLQIYFFRVIWVVFLIWEIVEFKSWSTCINLLFCFAQYALTIEEIPPPEDKVKLGVREA